MLSENISKDEQGHEWAMTLRDTSGQNPLFVYE